ncbi:MAG: heme exporter protein CcmD [Alphaproteobacteria bacterium]|nr:heme exporter protein CcmD [Alphaproteobacteria bacterium]
MDTVIAFFAMGGYAAFVWPAFAVAAVVMAGLVWSSVRALRHDRRTLALLETERPRRRKDPPG